MDCNAVGLVPPAAAERVQALMNNADRVILKVLPHDLGKRGKGFYSFCFADNLAPGDPRHPAKNISPYSALWDGNTNVTALVARLMIDRYRLTNIAGFKRLAVAAADLYLAEDPPHYDKAQGVQIFPLPVAAAIQLLLEVHELSGDVRYLKRAAFLGHEARVLFFDDISPLPMLSSDPRPKHAELYDTFTYGDDLMFALLKLHIALKATGRSDFK
jgi:hypothetical protein